jgi:hypothetical protein
MTDADSRNLSAVQTGVFDCDIQRAVGIAESIAHSSFRASIKGSAPQQVSFKIRDYRGNPVAVHLDAADISKARVNLQQRGPTASRPGRRAAFNDQLSRNQRRHGPRDSRGADMQLLAEIRSERLTAIENLPKQRLSKIAHVAKNRARTRSGRLSAVGARRRSAGSAPNRCPGFPCQASS